MARRMGRGDEGMVPMSFKRHRLPPGAIRDAVGLYFRFTLRIRDVEELLAQRSLEAVRCWVIKFGPLVAANRGQGRTAALPT